MACKRVAQKLTLQGSQSLDSSRDCRDVLQRTVSDLVRRTSKDVVPDVKVNGRGRVGATVNGAFKEMRACNDIARMAPEAYATRLFNFFGASHEVYILALVYIDRLFTKNPGIVVRSKDVNRLLFSSVMLALKFHQEECHLYPDTHYGAAGAVAMAEMRHLEAHLVNLLGWELFVDEAEYRKQQLQTILGHDNGNASCHANNNQRRFPTCSGAWRKPSTRSRSLVSGARASLRHLSKWP